jgi:hypothetical protein
LFPCGLHLIPEPVNESERMNYTILGGDDRDGSERVADYMGEVDWPYLKPHFERNCLFWVDPELDLEEVAKAFVEDRSDQVAEWLGAGDLLRIGKLHAAQWEGGESRFRAAVVSPFVLMTPR